MLQSAKVILISIVTSTVLVFGAGWYLKYSAEHGVERLSKAIEVETQRRDVEHYLEQNPYVPKSDSVADKKYSADRLALPQGTPKSDRKNVEIRPRLNTPADRSKLTVSEPLEYREKAELRSRTTSHQVETTGSVRVANVPDNFAIETGRSAEKEAQKGGQELETKSDVLSKHDPKLIRELQSQLKRVGCYGGDLDGIWGSQSQTALEKFSKLRGLKQNSAVPNMGALQSAVSSKKKVCQVKSVKQNVAVSPQKSKTDKANGSVQFRQCIQACRRESLKDLQDCVAIC